MKASIRSRLPENYLYARHDRRWIRRRLKPWWRRHRCGCCAPWKLESELYTPLTKQRIFSLRLHALEWLRLLAPLAPRLRGPLAQDCKHPDGFVSGIEIDVAGDDARPLLDLLATHGFRAERLTGIPGVVFSVDALAPIEILLRGSGEPPPLPDEPPRDAEQLEELMRDWHGRALAQIGS